MHHPTHVESPAHVAEVPMVTRTRAATVIVELSGPDAEVLAGILARYDVLASTTPQVLDPIRHYSPTVWHHTLIQLLRHVALLRHPIAEVVEVDASDVAGLGATRPTARPLRSV